MQTKAKSNSVITHTLAVREDGTAELTFIVKGAGNVVLDTAKLADSIIQRAAHHGLTQRISDAAAISCNTETGKPASPANKLAAMRALVDHYHTGTTEWSRKGDRVPSANQAALLLEALAVVYPEKEAETLKVFVDAKSRAEIAALLNHGEIKVAADMIRAEATKSVDAEKLLEGL